MDPSQISWLIIKVFIEYLYVLYVCKFSWGFYFANKILEMLHELNLLNQQFLVIQPS